MLFKGMNQCAAEQSDDTKQKLQYINAFVKNPRENKAAVESFLKDIYGVLSLLMNSNLKCDRVKLFVDKQGDDAFGTLTLRSNPIYGLNRRGKAKLHMCSISDTLTVAQEAWVVLTLARCYYHHFNTFIANGEVCPVSPQSLDPKQGTSNSYSQKDVDYFRTVYKMISLDRKAEKSALQNGSLTKSGRFCHWEYAAEYNQVALDIANGMYDEQETSATSASPPGEADVEIDDDSLVEDLSDIEF